MDGEAREISDDNTDHHGRARGQDDVGMRRWYTITKLGAVNVRSTTDTDSKVHPCSGCHAVVYVIDGHLGLEATRFDVR